MRWQTAVFAAAISSAFIGAVDPDGSSLDPIVVREERPAGKSASRSSEFAGSSMYPDARSETSLPRLLSRQQSVVPLSSGGDESTVVFQLRGQDPVQTRLFLEGIPLTDALFHSARLGWFAPELVSSIDLYPEATPAVLGGDGLGGAIVMKLNPPGTRPKAVSVRLGTLGFRRVAGEWNAGTRVPSSVFAEFFETKEDFAYRDPAGTPLVPGDDRWAVRQHNGQRAFSLMPRFRLWSRRADFVDVFSFHTIRRTELPGPIGEPQPAVLNSGYHLVGARAVLRQSADGQWELTGYGWKHAQDVESQAGLSALQLKRSDCQSLGLRASYSRDGAVGWEAGAGLAADSAAVESGIGKESSATRWMLPIGASLRLPVGASQFKPAIALQAVGFSGQGNRTSLLFSPRLGFEWAVSRRSRARASVGSYSRAPSLVELYGSASSINPNLGLRDEQAWKAEAGWDWRFQTGGRFFSEWMVSATVSAAWANDLILLIPNSQMTMIAQNIGRSRIVTPEIGLDIAIAQGWKARAITSFLSTENLSDVAAYRGRELPMRPAFRAGFDLEWQRERWRLSYQLSLNGPFFTDPANAKRVSGFAEHGLSGSWDSPFGLWMLELRNLADTATIPGQEWGYDLFQNTTGVAGFPGPGRRVYLSWRYQM